MLQHMEFYSGIGGMRLSVAAVLPVSVKHVCRATDVNLVANSVYRHNFGEAPRTITLEHCTLRDLQCPQAPAAQQDSTLLWTLSPPCQPYTATANSKQNDALDTRATSFAHIMQLMPDLPQLPTHILLENVVSFYCSQSHQQWLHLLQQLGYTVHDVALCPSQLGLPHYRPRHYTLAKRAAGRGPFSGGFSPAATAQLQQLQHGATGSPAATIIACEHLRSDKQKDHNPQKIPQQQLLGKFLQLDWSQQQQPLRQCSSEVQHQVQRYALPVHRVARYSKALDVVTPGTSTHSNCFTKGYMKNILGSGSFVMEDAAAHQLCRRDSRGRWHLEQYTYSASGSSNGCGFSCNNSQLTFGSSAGMNSSNIRQQATAVEHQESHQVPATQQLQESAQEALATQASASTSSYLHTSEDDIPPLLRVRAFTPREVANLQGFPKSFSFPDSITDRQAYAMLGNSVSIDAVSYLARLLLEDVVGSC